MVPGSLEHVFSRAVSMMAASERHKSYTIEDLGRLLAPPLVLSQFYMYENVFITWAFFDEETEHAFENQTRKLQPNDWRSGNICWAIDVVTVGDGPTHLLSAFRRVRKSLPEITTFKYRRWRPDRPRRYVTMEFKNGISPTKV